MTRDDWVEDIKDRDEIYMDGDVHGLPNTTSKFTEYYTQQLKEVITQLVKQHKEVKDKVTKIKLKETINVLKKTKIGRIVSDNQVSAMMIAYELISEIKNVRKEA